MPVLGWVRVACVMVFYIFFCVPVSSRFLVQIAGPVDIMLDRLYCSASLYCFSSLS